MELGAEEGQLVDVLVSRTKDSRHDVDDMLALIASRSMGAVAGGLSGDADVVKLAK